MMSGGNSSPLHTVINYDDEDSLDHGSTPLDHFWLEGDSLAPPCQSDIDVVYTILRLIEYYYHYMDKDRRQHDELTLKLSSQDLKASGLIETSNHDDSVITLRSNCNNINIDIFYDLGCGDGRICIEATRRFNCPSVGCEIEERLINRFRAHIKASALDEMVTVIHGDLRDIDLTRKGVISIYLLPEAIEAIRVKLVDALLRGSLIIFNTWGLKGIAPRISCTCGYANNAMLHLYDRSCVAS
jgi:SAM-dependent methyltransferase